MSLIIYSNALSLKVCFTLRKSSSYQLNFPHFYFQCFCVYILNFNYISQLHSHICCIKENSDQKFQENSMYTVGCIWLLKEQIHTQVIP